MPAEFRIGGTDWFDNATEKQYTLGHSIADLVDNCIDAEASNVQVKIGVEQIEIAGELVEGISFWIKDDGNGISSEKIRDVLSVKRREEDYTEIDLGAFGLGVPSSTLAQASHVTILSKKKNSTIGFNALSLIDRVQKDKARVLLEEDLQTLYPELLSSDYFTKAKSELEKMEKGTIVL